jgi:hypothetical protein
MIPSKTLDRFLCAFANYGWPRGVRDRAHIATMDAWLRSHKVFSRMIPGDLPRNPEWNIGDWQMFVRMLYRSPRYKTDLAANLFSLYETVLLTFKGAVNPPYLDLKTRDNYYFRALGGETRIGLKPDGFMQVVRRVLEIAPRMRKCGRTDCQHPFFLALRSSDVYCSKECSLWGKRRANLESWRKNWKRWPSSRWRAKGGRKKYGKGKRQ